MRVVKAISVTFGLLLGATLAAHAQRIDSTRLAELRLDRFVRIETPALGRIQGNVSQRSATELWLSSDGEHVIPIQEIQRAWVRGNHAKTGAIVGGILGAGGGLFFGLLIDAVCEGDCHGSVAAATLLGLGAGAGTGALIGMAFPRWKELH